MKAERGRDDIGYGHKRAVSAPFDEIVTKIRKSLMDEGFGVLTEIDMKAKLKEKLDVEIDDYIILGACNPPLAHLALQEDIDIGLLLPCNVIVYRNGIDTYVAAIDASKMLSVADNPGLEETAKTVNEKLRRAIDNV
jgi:uncharacterized protein (DUF302 family)